MIFAGWKILRLIFFGSLSFKLRCDLDDLFFKNPFFEFQAEFQRRSVKTCQCHECEEAMESTIIWKQLEFRHFKRYHFNSLHAFAVEELPCNVNYAALARNISYNGHAMASGNV